MSVLLQRSHKHEIGGRQKKTWIKLLQSEEISYPELEDATDYGNQVHLPEARKRSSHIMPSSGERQNPIPATKIAAWISARRSGTVITTMGKSLRSDMDHKFIKIKYS